MTGARRIVNIALPLVGLGVIVFYNYCGGSCTFLKGEVLRVDLKYLGLVYAVLLFLLALFRQDVPHLAVLSMGIGTEIYLVAFQVRNGTYCPYCLTFAAILVFLFLYNFRRSRLPMIGLAAAIGFLAFLLFFKGSATPVYGDEVLFPSFGKGKVQVRLYTDYFCGPCSRMEPKIEPLLKELIYNNTITLTLVDTPIHAATPLYARYFLYMLNEDRGFDQALRSRKILFEAAGDKIGEKERLEAYLKTRDVKFKEIDARPTFAALSALINEDRIGATPTCVIITNGKKKIFGGEAEITAALGRLANPLYKGSEGNK
ncbi:MAG: thioredoxin domain-containing protein [Syntrophorhabdales bacterium]